MNFINPYLLSMQIIASLYLNKNIPTSAPIFIFNDAFNIARSVRNVLGWALLGDVQLISMQ